MDKNEYNLKLEEIDRYVDQGNYAEAARVADQIDWRRVRNVRTLCLISEIYEAENRFEDSKALLVRAYRKSPVGRAILYRLVEVTIKLKQFDEAIEYYSEYVQAAPHDNNKYILKYKIYRGRGSSVNEQIEILREYLDQEYNECYAYELAKLYREADRIQECLATCDDLVLWFHSGKYVIKALELKMKYAALTPKQQEIYDHRFDEEEKELGQEKQIVETSSETPAEAIVEDATRAIADEIAKVTQQEDGAAVEKAVESVQDGQDLSATRSFDGMSGTEESKPAESSAEGAQAGDGSSVTEDGGSTQPAHDGDEASGRAETAGADKDSMEIPLDEPVRDAKAFDEQLNRFNTQELQTEMIKSMREIVSGVGIRDTVDLDEEAADRVIEESKKEQETLVSDPQQAARVNMTRRLTIPELQKKRAANQLSIDDVLLSMGERGSAVREAARTPQTGVLSAVDEALLNMGVEADRAEDVRRGRVQTQENTADAVDKTQEEPITAAAEPEAVSEEPETAETEPEFAVEEPETVETAEAEPEFAVEAAEPEDGAETEPEVDEEAEKEAGAEAEHEAEAEAEKEAEAEAAFEAEAEAEEEAGAEAEAETEAEEEAGAEAEAEAEAENEAEAEKETVTESSETQPDMQKAAADDDDIRIAGPVAHAPAESEKQDNAPEQSEEQSAQTGDAGQKLSMDEIINAKTRRMPTDEISHKYEDARAQMKASGEAEGAAGKGESPDQSAADEAAEAPEIPGPRLKPWQRSLFDGYLGIRNMEPQIAGAIQLAVAKGPDRTSRSGNILIFGGHGCGKTTIATGLARAIARERGSQSVKMAKIYATDLNRKDIAATIARIAGGILIIEEAGDLEDSIADQLTTAMEFRTDGLIVILEDEQRYMHDLLMRHPRFTMKFTSQIYIPAYTVDDLVGFGTLYADDRDYALSPEGSSRLAAKLSAMMEQGENLSITNVLDQVDAAIARANKFGRKLFSGKKRFDSEGRVVLLEKDFR